jgi:hypothetical protein
MDNAAFRAAFPEFANPTRYPAASIDRKLTLAGKLLNADRWGELLDDGTGLFVAHYLTLERKGGQVAAPVATKTVDKVTQAYDTQAVALTDAGHYGATSYGVQLLQLARMVGAGGIQL